MKTKAFKDTQNSKSASKFTDDLLLVLAHSLGGLILWNYVCDVQKKVEPEINDIRYRETGLSKTIRIAIRRVL